MIQGRWFITPHAVERYIERVRPTLDYDRALAELVELSDRAHEVSRTDAFILFRAPKPTRCRLRVSHEGQLMTVLPPFDGWAPTGDKREWQKQKALSQAAPMEAAPREAAPREGAPREGAPREAEASLAVAGAAAAEAEAGSALRSEDIVHASSAQFRRRVDESLRVIAESVAHGAIGVSFSGGKDSTCVLDLVRRVRPDAVGAFFDSGAELMSTRDIVRRYELRTIFPRLTMQEMARYAGWWGAEPVDHDATFDAKAVLIQEPAETFVVRERLRVIAHGVRAEESGARVMHVRSRGSLYRGADGTWVCMPIAKWSTADVWAYIASRGLRYNTAYDRMAALGIDRRLQRIGGTLGERGSGWGRHEILRTIEPETWTELRREFPLLGVSA